METRLTRQTELPDCVADRLSDRWQDPENIRDPGSTGSKFWGIGSFSFHLPRDSGGLGSFTGNMTAMSSAHKYNSHQSLSIDRPHLDSTSSPLIRSWMTIENPMYRHSVTIVSLNQAVSSSWVVTRPPLSRNWVVIESLLSHYQFVVESFLNHYWVAKQRR